MKIRDFTLKDQDELKALALRCWRFAYKDFFSDRKIENTVDKWYSEKVHKQVVEGMKNGSTLAKVVEEKGKLIDVQFKYEKESFGFKRGAFKWEEYGVEKNSKKS